MFSGWPLNPLHAEPLGGDKLLSRFDRVTKRETPLITLEQDLFRVVDALDRSNIVVQEYGGVIEVINVAKRRKIRRISGLNSVLAANRKRVAWQTPLDITSHPEQHSHVLLSDIDSHDQLDLGEGAAPVFLPDELTLLFVRVDDANHQLDVVRYNTRSKIQEAQATKSPEFMLRFMTLASARMDRLWFFQQTAAGMVQPRTGE